MAKLFKTLFSRAGRKSRLEKAMDKDMDKSLGQNLVDTLGDLFPQVQPKRWSNYEGIRRDGKMLLGMFYNSVNYFKDAPKGSHSEEKHYESKDDYLRQEKLSPLKLKQQMKRLTIYSIICYALALAIFIYTAYISINVSILDGIICGLFGFFVFVKGLQFSLFIRQVKTGNFKTKLKNLFSR